VVTSSNYYTLFNGILNPKQLEGLRLLLTPFAQQQFNETCFSASSSPRGAVLCASPHSFGAPRRPTFPPLNLHRARVRRNRRRLPSSRCIESAPEHHTFILILLLMRSSDTSLGLLEQSGGSTLLAAC